MQKILFLMVSLLALAAMSCSLGGTVVTPLPTVEATATTNEIVAMSITDINTHVPDTSDITSESTEIVVETPALTINTPATTTTAAEVTPTSIPTGIDPDTIGEQPECDHQDVFGEYVKVTLHQTIGKQKGCHLKIDLPKYCGVLTAIEPISGITVWEFERKIDNGDSTTDLNGFTIDTTNTEEEFVKDIPVTVVHFWVKNHTDRTIDVVYRQADTCGEVDHQ